MILAFLNFVITFSLQRSYFICLEYISHGSFVSVNIKKMYSLTNFYLSKKINVTFNLI